MLRPLFVVAALSGALPALGAEPDLSGLDAVREAYIAVWLQTPLTVRSVALTDGPATGMGSYTPAKGNVFKPGETINLYAEVIGYHWKPAADGASSTDLNVDLTLLTPDDVVVASKPKFFHYGSTAKRLNLETFFAFSVTLSEFAPGDYKLHYKLTDAVSNEVADFEVPIVLKP